MANEITLSVNGTKQSLGLRPMRGFAMSLYDAAVRLKGRPARRRFRADDGH
jgi:hypothetical protein